MIVFVYVKQKTAEELRISDGSSDVCSSDLLGLVFTWGALVGWPAATGRFDWPALALYAGAFWWVMGYDTIYALQDVEDDEIVGVKSSALRLGARSVAGIAFFYGFALVGLGAALWLKLPDPLVFAGLIPVALHFLWQVVTLDPADGPSALRRFRSNRFAGKRTRLV